MSIKFYLAFLIKRLSILAMLITLLSCNSGTQLKLTISPKSHNFGVVGIGTNFTVTFTIKNNVGFSITLLTFEIQGSNNSEFSFVSGAVNNTVIGDKGTHNIEVKFTPVTEGDKTAKILITHNGNQKALEASLSGKGSKIPVFVIDPTSYDFGQVLIGLSSDINFTISNPGFNDLTISDIQIASTPPFSIQAGWTGIALTITSGNSSILTVRYTPQNVGTDNGTITFTHNSTNSPTIVNLKGSGTNAIPQISIDPTVYDFGTVSVGNTSAPATFIITNTGNAQLNVTDISFTGTNFTDFAKVAVLPMNIAPSGNAQFTATFTPSAAGSRNAVLTIMHNAAGSPLIVNVTGTGTTAGTPTVLLNETFDVGSGWGVDSGPASMGFQWYIEDGTNGPHPNFPGNANITGGSGNFANCDSDIVADLFGPGVTLDEYLISPVIDCSTYTTGTISFEFNGNYQRYDSNTFDDFGGILVFDGVDWQVLDVYDTDWNAAGEKKQYDVSTYARGNADFQIIFYYTGEDDWFFQVDNVKVSHTP